MSATRRRRMRRSGILAPIPPSLVLHRSRRTGPSLVDGLLALLFLVAVGALIAASRAVPVYFPDDEVEVVLIEEELPPPPEEIPPLSPPPPPPPVPDPDEVPPPPQPGEPPPPQFGLPDDALSEGGDLAVATGNTLMVRADTVVRPPPPPLPPAPIQLDQTPRILRLVEPEYPSWAIDAGVEARVLALVTIDPAGRVTDVAVRRSGGRDFDQATLRALRQMRFTPHVSEGRAVLSTFPFEQTFSLQ